MQNIFISDPYFNHTNIDEAPLRDLLGQNVNKLIDKKSASLKGDSSYTEIAHALINIENNKSHCLDSFTVEFLKVFFFFFFWGGGGVGGI